MSRDTALVYVRVSRLDEEERARKISPEMQSEKALALHELQGLAVEKFEDLDISGKATANRPGYLAMLERLRNGDVRYVTAYDLSRVTRTLRDQADFFEILQRNGAQFIEASTGREIDPEDEDEELGANVLGSVNQHFRRKTARRIRDALASKVAKGELVGPVPAGYLRKKEVLPSGKVARTWVEPDPERAPIIQLVFREYATGNYTYKSLAIDLNRREVPQPRPPHFKNNRTAAEIWTADVLKDLLCNPRYVGRVPRRDGQTFAAAYPPLIDAETWAACERTRMKRRPMAWNRASQGRRRWASPYLLSSVLRCQRCGSTMSGETWQPDSAHREPRRRYTCYRRRTARACDAPYIRQDDLEAQLLDVMREICLPDGFAEAVDSAVGAYLATPAKSRRATRKQIEAEKERWLTLYTKGRVSEERYDAEQVRLDADIAALDATPRLPDIAKQRETLKTLVDDWPAMTIEERKRLVGLVFQEIHADHEAGGISRFMARPEWRPYMRTAVGVLTRLPVTIPNDNEPARVGNVSGRRVSNPRPRTWQARALPTELLPRGVQRIIGVARI